MISTTLFPGRYVQGAGALSRLGAELSRLGKRHLLICSPSPLERLLPGGVEPGPWGGGPPGHPLPGVLVITTKVTRRRVVHTRPRISSILNTGGELGRSMMV